MLVKPGQRGAVVEIENHVLDGPRSGHPLIEQCREAAAPLPGQRRYGNRRSLAPPDLVFQPLAFLGPQQVDLVLHLDHAAHRRLAQAHGGENGVHVQFLRFRIDVGGVAHVEDDVGFADLLEGRLEGGDQFVRQVGDETHGVGQDHRAPRRQVEAAHGGVEGGEQLVTDRHLGAGEGIEKGRLSGVGVPHQRHHRIRHPPSRLAVQTAGALDLAEVAPEAVDSLIDEAPVGFDLGLAGAAHEAEAAALPLQVGPGAHQARALVGERRQLHLERALARARPGPEDLEDQAGAVDHLAVPGAFQVALLNRGQRRVDDGDGDVLPGGDDLVQPGHRSAAEDGRRAHTRHVDHLGVDDPKADGAGQTHGLVQPCLGRAHAIATRLDVRVHDHTALATGSAGPRCRCDPGDSGQAIPGLPCPARTVGSARTA